MPVISNQFTIDAAQGLQVLQNVQQSFQTHNAAVGAISAQYASFNRESKTALATFTQIDQAGKKITTTLKDTGAGYEAVSVKIGTATAAQRRFSAEMERQSQLADRLAKSIARAPAGPSVTPTLTPGAIDPALIGQNLAFYARLTPAQLQAAAAANNLTGAQTATLLNLVANSSRATNAIDKIRAGTDALKKRFDSLGEIAFATFIYRGLSLIQAGLVEGTRSAAQYSRQIGLIQTLATNTTDNYGAWDRSIRQVADALALPAVEVATATYDALSNQVIKTTKDMGLLTVAGTLARNTNANITDSLNVLSSILNTYGSQAGTAQQISDELFKTVDLGRVRINELNGVIGRSAGIARTAGVSLRELEAGLIVQTQAGLDSAESATLLNNVFSQLIKPNDALAAQFRKMGFDSGPAAIGTLRLAGVMRELAKAAKETDEGIATFFPEIRGLRGAATFAGEGIDKFEEALRALESAQGANAKAAQILKTNLGQSLIDEGQRLKNFFTVDLGQQALESITFLSTQIGGIDNAIKVMFPTLITAGVLIGGVFAVAAATKFLTLTLTIVDGFFKMTKVIDATSAVVTILEKDFTKAGVAASVSFGLVAVAAAVVYGWIVSIDNASARSAEAVREAANAQSEALKKAAEEAANAQITEFNRTTDETSRKYGAFVAEMKKANETIRESTVEVGKDIGTRLKNNFDVITNIARQGLNKLEAEQKKAADNSLKIDKERASATDDFEKKQFDRRIKAYDDLRKHNESLGQTQYDFPRQDPVQQILKLTNQRNDRLRALEAAAIGRGDLDTGRALLNEIQGNIDKLDSYRAEQAQQQGRRGRGPNSIRGRGRQPSEFEGLNQDSANELKYFISLTEQLREADKARTVELANQVEQEKQQVAALDDILKKTTTFVQKGVFDKNGDILGKFADDPAKALEKLQELQQEALDAAGSLQGITDPLTNVQYQAALDEIKKTFADQTANLQEQLAIAQVEKSLTRKRQAYEETATASKAAIADIVTQLKEEGLAIDQTALKAQAAARAMAAQLNTGYGSSSTVNRLLAGVRGQGFGGTEDYFNTLVDSFNKTLSGKGTKNVGLAEKQLADIKQLVQANAPDFKIVDPDDATKQITYLENITRMERTLIELDKQQKAAVGHQERLDAYQSSLTAINKEMLESLSEANPGLAELNGHLDRAAGSTLEVDKLADAFFRLSQNIKAAKENAAGLNQLGIGGGGIGSATNTAPVSHASGGRVTGNWWTNFLMGAYAKGTDVVPAMLSKKEFVVRAPMADKYYSQLVAMNAGVAPVYRSQGGLVTTTTVGDIHINVSGGQGNSLQMSREVANHIRRGIKNGTLKLS